MIKIFFHLIAVGTLISTITAQVKVNENIKKTYTMNANIRLEQNVTDEDIEVVFEIKGKDRGFNNLSVLSPDGRKVFNFTAPDSSTLGIRQFHLESPEPKDIQSIKAAYPEGLYKFTATDAEGRRYSGECMLNHSLPETSSIISPRSDVPTARLTDLEISWHPVQDINAYVLEIEQEELDLKITVQLPSSVNKYFVTKDILKPGLEYSLSIGTVSENYNCSFTETKFMIAGED